MITMFSGKLYFDTPFYPSVLLSNYSLCKLTFFFDMYFVLANTSSFTLKLSSLEWLLFTWHSFVLWATRMMLEPAPTALRLGQMKGNSFERVHHEVFAIATKKSGIAMIDSLFNESQNNEKNNRIQMMVFAYQIFVADVILMAFFVVVL